MTNEQKAKYFGLYLGQTVGGHECDLCSFKLTEISFLDCEIGLWGDWSGGTNPDLSCNDMVGIDSVWLNLRSIESLTDEEKTKIARLCGYSQNDGLKVGASHRSNTAFNGKGRSA